MTTNHTDDGINSTSITTLMNSYMASLKDQPDLGFLAFLKLALRKNDDVSEELTVWLVESWWGLMSEVQESNAPAPTRNAARAPGETHTAPDGIDQALLARLMHMRINKQGEKPYFQPIPPLKITSAVRSLLEGGQ
ncbi:MAG: hypothetical protein IIC27_01235 [Chloroflexi bacterium]|nr:hypothetical protein [Chloroflexota bacterium]